VPDISTPQLVSGMLEFRAMPNLFDKRPRTPCGVATAFYVWRQAREKVT